MSWLALLGRRAADQRTMLAAAFAVILVTTVLAATLGRFGTTIGDAAVRGVLAAAPGSRTDVVLDGVLGSGDLAAGEQAAQRYQVPGYPGAVRTSGQTSSFAFPAGVGSSAGTDPALTSFWTADGVAAHAALRAGRWPSAAASPTESASPPDGAPTGPVVPVALPESAATALHLAVGARITVAGRLDPHPVVTVAVVGIFQPVDLADPFWRLDPLTGSGVQRLGYTSYGPLLTDRSEFAQTALHAQNLRVEIVPDLTRMRAADVGPLIAQLNTLTQRAHEDPALGTPDVATGLPGLLAPLPTALVVNRSGMLVPTLQLLVLAAAALLLTARSLLGRREPVDVLIRARGAGPVGLAGLAVAEAVLLTAPAVVAAVPMARVLLPLLPHGGGGRLPHTADGDPATLLASAAAALLCALALGAPAVGGGASRVAVLASRSGRAVALRRAGLDLAVLLLAALAFWQLRGHPPVATEGSGSVRLDPFVVAGPAILLFAGAVVVVRLLPLAGRLADRTAARGRRLPAALAGWEIGRGARRHAGPVLLLVMAFAMVVFALCYSTTWQNAQTDQAEFAVGADVRVAGSTLPSLGQAGEVTAAPGVVASAAVLRTTAELPELGSVTVLAVDSRTIGDVLRLRPDLAPQGAQAPRTIASKLAAGRPLDAGLVAPGRPTALEATLRATVRIGAVPHGGSLSVTVEDAAGQTRTLAADLATDGATHTVHWDLAELTGPAHRFAWPLRVTGIGYRVDAPVPAPVAAQGASADPAGSGSAPTDQPTGSPPQPAQVVIDVLRISTLATGDAAVGDLISPAPAAIRLSTAASHSGAGPWSMAPAAAEPATTPPGELLRFAFTTGVPSPDQSPGEARATGQATLTGPARDELPAVASDAFLAKSGHAVGDTLTVTCNGASVQIHIVGSVRGLPTTRSADAGLLVDDAALLATVTDKSATGMPEAPREWWIRTTPGATTQVATTLRAAMSAESVLDRRSARAALLADPLQDGLRGTLAIAAFAATTIAAVGFALSSVTAARERTGQTAVLRVLGLPRRQLAFVAAAEQSVVVGVGGLAGTALGLLLAHTLVPRIALSRDGTAPPVPVLVHVPWLTLLGTGLAAFAAFGLVGAAVLAVAQRSGLVSALRLGDER